MENQNVKVRLTHEFCDLIPKAYIYEHMFLKVAMYIANSHKHCMFLSVSKIRTNSVFLNRA